MIVSYVFLVLALIFTTIGQISYKIYFQKKKIFWLVCSLASFVGVPFFNYIALLRLSIDTVYISTALTIIMIMFASSLILKEHISKNQFWGAMTIIVGIVVYNL